MLPSTETPGPATQICPPSPSSAQEFKAVVVRLLEPKAKAAEIFNRVTHVSQIHMRMPTYTHVLEDWVMWRITPTPSRCSAQYLIPDAKETLDEIVKRHRIKPKPYKKRQTEFEPLVLDERDLDVPQYPEEVDRTEGQ